MSENTQEHPTNYMLIFKWLIALTIVEVFVAWLPLPKASVATLLVVSAVAKAALVALYFMHLMSEKFLILLMVIFSFVLSVIFVLGLFPDIVMSSIRL